MQNSVYHDSDLSELSFLVTGGAGFIGSNLVEYLLKNNAKLVRVLDDLSTGHIRNIELFRGNRNFEFIEGSICDLNKCLEVCNNIDFVLHQAALGSVPRSIVNPLATHEVNVTGFLNTLIAARDNRVKRFVYASSSSVYGDSSILPKSENFIGRPLSPYAVTKQANELYADVFAKNYNMEIIGLRYFNVFGPRQSPEGAYAAAIPLFINAMTSGKSPVIHGDGEQTRDFTYVQNVIQANIKAIFSSNDALGKVYNIAMGETISVNELFKTIRENLGVESEAVYVSPRHGDILHSHADISLAQKYLRYSPEIGFREGIKHTLDWFRQCA